MTVREYVAVSPEVDWTARQLEGERRGRGLRFVDAYREIVDTLRRFPQLYPLVDDPYPPHEVRNALVRRSDYRVIYVVRPDEVIIVAVSHGSRRPGHWHRRLDDPDL